MAPTSTNPPSALCNSICRLEQLRPRVLRPLAAPKSIRCQAVVQGRTQGTAASSREPLRFRTVFISDVHLGTPQAQAQALLEFLDQVDTETLYLVGDIVDGWKLKSSWFWPDSHNDVIQKILQLARTGTNIIYIPGNHDEGVRCYLRDEALWFGNVVIVEEMRHQTADGRTFLVLHGDRCDHAYYLSSALKRAVGDWVYDRFVDANIAIKVVRQHLGMPYWSLAAHVTGKSKFAQGLVDQFEMAVAKEASRLGVDGVICGHIHKPEIRRIGDVLYCNDGDWVDSCTALVEDYDGSLRILSWMDHLAAQQQQEDPNDEVLVRQQGRLLRLGSPQREKEGAKTAGPVGVPEEEGAVR